MEIELNLFVRVYGIYHIQPPETFLLEDLNGCWTCEVYTNYVELFKCIPSQDNDCILILFIFDQVPLIIPDSFGKLTGKTELWPHLLLCNT